MMSNVAVLLVLLAYGHAIRVARQECASSGDCSQEKVCAANLCEDPCPGFCGENTECQVKWHTPTCRCRQGYNGDPMQGCTEAALQECSFNGDCPLDKACEKHSCEDPCTGLCGNNTMCEVKRHMPVCSCRQGFTGEPMLGCTESVIQECSFNGECPLEKACEQHRCEDPCLDFCGNNTVCQVKRHIPVCSCRQGFVGDPMLGCTESVIQECSFNGECPLDKACEQHRCEDPCLDFCGSNTDCQVKRHIPVCSCRQGFVGDPMLGCTDSALQGCSFNGDCSLEKACEKHKCEDPCLDFCGNNTVCQVKRHVPVCSCVQGFIGEPMLGCTDSAPTPEVKETTTKTTGKKMFVMQDVELLDWLQAFVHCQSHSMRLPIIENKEQDDDLVAVIKNSKKSSSWLGATDIYKENEWYWMTTGKPIRNYYTNWYSGDPDGGSEQNCLCTWNKYNFQWIDNTCSSKLSFACEYYV